MAHVSVVLISHSQKLGEGLKDILLQLTGNKVHIESASGIDGELGTSAMLIRDALQACPRDRDIIVLFDLGSALLSCETAIDLLDQEDRDRVQIVDAPLVEGAIAAAVQASLGGRLQEVAASAESAKTIQKRV